MRKRKSNGKKQKESGKKLNENEKENKTGYSLAKPN
jgi:hypothetical protein